jgi:hypothetical protein
MLGQLFYVISAQTAPLKQDLNEAKSAMKQADNQMKKSGKVITDESKKMSGEAGNALAPMEQGLNAINPAAGQAVAGMKSATTGAKVLNAALGPIGLAVAAVGAAVGALTAYFKGSVEGQEKMAKIMAYLGGVVDTLKDGFIDLGKWIMTAIHSPRDALEQLMNRFQGFVGMVTAGWQVISQGAKGVALSIKGIFSKEARDEAKLAFDQMKQGMDDFRESAKQAWEGVKDLGKAIKERANESVALQERENKLKMQQIDSMEKIARLDAEIAAARLIANDSDRDTAEQMAAQEKAMELVNQKFQMQQAMAKESLAIQRERMALGHDTIADMEEEARLATELVNLETSRDSMTKSLRRRYGTIQNQREAEHQAAMKAIDDEEKARQAALNMEMEARTKILEEIRKAGLTDVEVLQETLDKKLEMYEWSEAERLKIVEHYQEQMKAIRDRDKNEQQETMEELGQSWETLAQIAGAAVAGMANEIGAAMAGAETNFKSMANSMLNSIQQVINGLFAKAVAGLFTSEVSSKGIFGLASAAVGIGALKSMWNSNVPKMAMGGVIPPGFPNDTYPALLSSGETVTPPGKLPGGILSARISGGDLLFLLNDAQAKYDISF